MGKPSINVPFSIAMLNNQRVTHKKQAKITIWFCFTQDINSGKPPHAFLQQKQPEAETW